MPGLRSGLAVALAVALPVCGGGLAAQQATMHAPDGGTRQRIESLVIPATPNAPFSAVVATEWTTILPDGSTQTIRNH